MSKGAASIVVLFLILLLTAVFFFRPDFIFRTAQKSEFTKELVVQRLTSLGNSIAHAAFVEDAIIMGEVANLSEIVIRLQKDEPELTFVHITDAKNMILASSDSSMFGKTYSHNTLGAGRSAVREQSGVYEGGFSINVGQKRVGVLYFGMNPNIEHVQLANEQNPLSIIIGIAVACVAFLVMLVSRRNIKAKLRDDLNKRQEGIFSPKIEALKQAQNEAQNRLKEVNEQINNAERDLQRFNEEYETRKKEAESDPLVQSVEKLKTAEVDLIKRIEGLKEEEAQLNTEINLLSQKREEILNALEVEKKEERTLHEKLDLIKKKILHLETPGK